MCEAAQSNKTDQLIKILDEEITDINKPYNEEDGWTALHFACAAKNFKCAEILIDNGADIHLPTRKGKTYFNLIKDKEMQEKLEIMYKVIKANKTTGSFGWFSIFSRHPEHIDDSNKKIILSLKETLETKMGRMSIITSLPS